MKKTLFRKIFIAAVSVLLSCCLFVMQPLAATTATEWQQTYTRTVMQNASYYYGKMGNINLDLTFYEANFSNRDWYCVYYDFRSLNSIVFGNYLEYGSTLGSVPSDSIPNLNYDLCYLWWLPINGENLDNTGSFQFRIIISGIGYYTSGSRTWRFATGDDLLKYQAQGRPAFSFYGYKEGGLTTDIGSGNFHVDSTAVAHGFSVPDWWPAGSNNYYVDVTFTADNIQEFDALGIRFYTFCNTLNAVTTYINPYIILAIDPADMMIYEPGSTPPDTSEPGETTPPNPNQDVLDEIAVIGSQLQQMESILTVPDEEASRNVAEIESVLESKKDQADSMFDVMQQITVDFENMESVLGDIGIGRPQNPYDDSWLKAVFGGLWSNKYILHMLVLSTAMAMFGFVLFGKKA